MARVLPIAQRHEVLIGAFLGCTIFRLPLRRSSPSCSFRPKKKTIRPLDATLDCRSLSGSAMPVAAKTALATAGPIGSTPGSTAGRRFGRLHDMHLDLGHLVDAQHPIAIEVGLLDFAILERDGDVDRGTQAQSRCRLPFAR